MNPKSFGRQCHDCGRPTTDYRCEACWKRVREAQDTARSDIRPRPSWKEQWKTKTPMPRLPDRQADYFERKEKSMEPKTYSVPELATLLGMKATDVYNARASRARTPVPGSKIYAVNTAMREHRITWDQVSGALKSESQHDPEPAPEVLSDAFPKQADAGEPETQEQVQPTPDSAEPGREAFPPTPPDMSDKGPSRKRIYLAVPYTHPDAAMREERFKQVTTAAAAMSAGGDLVYSPITHGHVLNRAAALPSDFAFWEEHCLSFLRLWATDLHVLCLPGWRDSTGVQAELAEAERLKLPTKLHFV